MTDNNRKLIEELERRLCWYRDEATDEEFDVEEVDAICTMLQKLSPEDKPHRSREEAYRNIMQLIREEEREEDVPVSVKESGLSDEDAADGIETETTEATSTRKAKDGRKRNFPFRKRGYRAAILFIVVFGAALLSLNMVTYARENKSLFRMILESVGWVRIVKEPEVGDSLIEGEIKNEIFYDSWAELDKEIKRKIIVPSYIPKGYTLYGIKYWNFNNRERVQADYYSEENGHLLLEITLLENDAKQYKETRMDEDVCVLLSEYSDENTLYYQYEDEYICMIFMGNSFYRVSGNISLEEMIKVRKGLENVR